MVMKFFLLLFRNTRHEFVGHEFVTLDISFLQSHHEFAYFPSSNLIICHKLVNCAMKQAICVIVFFLFSFKTQQCFHTSHRLGAGHHLPAPTLGVQKAQSDDAKIEGGTFANMIACTRANMGREGHTQARRTARVRPPSRVDRTLLHAASS